MIAIKKLSKYFGKRVIFDDLNLSFDKGKIYALIGESGSGKTTLLNILAKLETYDSGSVTYDGTDLKEIKSQVYYRDYLGYLFQNFGLIENDSISYNLDLGLVGKKLRKNDIQECKEKVMKDVHLEHLNLNQKIYELSGGEAQRIKLATELSRRSTGRTIYVLDEPTTGLHFADVHRLVDILRRLCEGGNTVVVIEHNLDVIKTADYIIDIGPEGGEGGGTVVATGTPEEIAKCKKSYTGQYLKKYLKK